MKIVSWNVNGLRAVERKEALGEFLNDVSPDILLLQETKSKPDQVGFLDTVYPDYEKFFVSAQKPGYSGVSIWLHNSVKSTLSGFEFVAGMPRDPVVDEGRIARLNFTVKGAKYAVLGAYFPNGGKSPEAWQHKLQFYEAWLDYVNSLRDQGYHVIWAGDVNCAHQPIDLARPKENDGVIGFHPDERAWLDKWHSAGWVDVWRERNPNAIEVYSWWHLISKARTRNVGWRIDYFWADGPVVDQIKDVGYLTQQMGSDHCPVWIELSV